MGVALAVVTAVVSIAATGFSIYSQMQASKEQDKARKVQQQQQENQVERERVRAIRAQRIQRARALNIAAQQGAFSPGSSVVGGVDSTTSQLGSALGFSSEQLNLSRLASFHLGRAGRHSQNAQLFGGIAGISNSIYGMTPGVGSFFTGTQTQQQNLTPFSPLVA